MNPYLIPAMKTHVINKQLSDISKPEQIVNIVSSYFCEHTPIDIRFPNVDTKGLNALVKSTTRKREIIEARFAICYFIKTMLNTPLESIGLLLGGRDHSSIIHAVSSYADVAQTSPLHFKRHDELCGLLSVDNQIQPIKRRK